MTDEEKNVYDALERIFHEPNRLAIMSAVCAADEGISFSELREQCNLTDGNLNRHLKVLQEAGVVRVEKAFVDLKPRTTIFLSDRGVQRFGEYLDALSGVLDKARNALPATGQKAGSIVALGRTVKA